MRQVGHLLKSHIRATTLPNSPLASRRNCGSIPGTGTKCFSSPSFQTVRGHHSIQWVAGINSLDKRPRREADNSLPPDVEFKNEWS